ncbi:MAG: aldo/keto reductase [Bacillota bacterium]
MKYRALGNSGLLVSEVGLGCEYFAGKDAATVNAMMDEAMDRGVNIMDVFMAQPEIRSNLGEALRGRREKMILQGHVGSVWADGQYKCSRDLKECKSAIADFLDRFHTDYIDIGMLHYVDEIEEWNTAIQKGIIDYLIAQKKAGVFRAIGVSSHDPLVSAEMVKSGVIDVLMFSINPLFDLVFNDMERFFTMKDDEAFPETLDIDPNRAALYALCAERGVGITVMKPLAAGCLLTEADSPFGVPLTVAQCIAYALNRPAVASVLVGCGSVEQVIEAASFDELPDEAKTYADVVARITGSPKPKCMYCNHCLPCPAGIDIAAVTRILDEARQTGVTAELRRQYATLACHGENCIDCGQCVARCPFGIDAQENMKEIAALSMMTRE